MNDLSDVMPGFRGVTNMKFSRIYYAVTQMGGGGGGAEVYRSITL